MSGGTTSLESAIRTCKVNTGNANKLESDRFLGESYKKTCPNFQGTDLIGRSIASDTWNTKSRGCNTAEDRIWVENAVERPHYYEYVTLSNRGPDGREIPITDEMIEGFGFGQQEAAFIREGTGYGRPTGAPTMPKVSPSSPVALKHEDIPSDLRFNSMQAVPFNNMPLYAFNVIPPDYYNSETTPYPQMYGQAAEEQRIKQALWVRSKIMDQNPIIPAPTQRPYRMMYNYV